MLQSWISKQVTIATLKYTLNFSFEYIKYFTVVASRFYEDDTVNFFLISNFD